MTTDDVTLVRRCLRGEDDAIGALVRRFQAEVYGLCVRLLNHRHDAEDVTQEVFLRVFRSLRGWDPQRPLKPWVMGIAVNRCRTWMAQRVRRPELVDYLQDTAPGPVADDSAEVLAEIKEREFVRVGELSDRFGVSEVTVRGDLDSLAARGKVHRVRGGAIGDCLGARFLRLDQSCLRLLLLGDRIVARLQRLAECPGERRDAAGRHEDDRRQQARHQRPVSPAPFPQP